MRVGYFQVISKYIVETNLERWYSCFSSLFLLQFHQVDYLAVAYADEGVELRKAGITLPVMVMNAEEVTYDLLVQHNLEPEIFSFGILSTFEDYLLL